MKRLWSLCALALLMGLVTPIGTAASDVPVPERVTPCTKGKAKGATDVGVNDDTITIATIQDIGGIRPGLFLSNQQAMKAFVAYCNSLGGINGRKLELVTYDSALLDAYPQYVKACDSSFAIVGEALGFDDAGLEPAEKCGIPSVAAMSATQRAASPLVFNPLPNPPGKFAVGKYLWLKKKYPGVNKRAAMIYPSTSKTKSTGEKQKAGMGEVGFDFAYTGVSELNIVNWGPLVDQLRQHESTYVAMVYDVPGWAAFQRELVAQGVKVPVMEANAAEYTPKYLEQAGAAAEETIIPLSTAPFDDAKKIPELAAYLKWVKKIDGEPTSLGLQGWSSGLLFATAAQSLGSNLTRAGLVDALTAIHSWDGNGIQAPADPGGRVPSGCFLYMQVKNGKFVRLHPKKGFDCSNPKVVDIPADL